MLSARSRTRSFGILPSLVFGLSFIATGCMHVSTSSKSTNSGNDPFEEKGDKTRETILIEPTEGTQSFEISPALFDTAMVKVDAKGGSPAIVDVLIKGSFPEGCFELNALDQEPMRSGQRVTLTMRRPAEAICTQVVRPYRFFFTLDRRFDPGRYTLEINDRSFAFEVTDTAK